MNKRRSLILALLLAMTMVLSACGPVATEYYKKSEAVQKWPGTEVEYKATMKMTMKMDDMIEAEGEEEVELEDLVLEFPFDIKGMTQGEDKAHLVIDMSGMTTAMETELTAEEQAELEEMAMFKEPIIFYIDGADVYISKNYFVDMGAEELKDLKEDYVKIVSDADVSRDQLINFSNNFTDLLSKYEGSKDMTKDGNTYSFDLNATDLKNEIVGFTKYFKANQDDFLDAFAPLIQYTGVTGNGDLKAALKEGLDELKVEEIEAQLNEFLPEMEGTRIKGSTTFEDDKVTQDFDFNIEIKDLMSIDYIIKGTNKKLDQAKIVYPTSYKEYTQEELNELLVQLPEDYERFVFVTIDEEPVDADVAPFIENGRTLVPVRAIMEAVDAEVEWDNDTQMVTITHDDKNIELVIGSKEAKVNGEIKELDVPAKLVQKRTFVPIRFVSEALGYDVGYEMTDFAHEISITTK